MEDWTDLTWLMDWLGDRGAAAALGAVIGVIFGVAAQRSRFCLRAAAVEFSRGRLGERMAVWLLCFATALFWTQLFRAQDLTSLPETRWLGRPGSFSGAVIGGLIFGAGMVLTRGCPGRLLVLAAGGNLRAFLTGMVFAVTAQMSLHGALSPLRERLTTLWLTDGPNPELGAIIGFSAWGGVLAGLAFSAIALVIAYRNRVSFNILLFGPGVGFAVGAGWLLTSLLSQSAFEPTPVESITFSGPSADALMSLLVPHGAADFGVALVGGVFAGAFLAALVSREAKFEGFDGAPAMRRYILGGAMMGFGAMLAGGCSIGAGVTGTSVLALTAWVALTAIFVGAVIADRAVDGGRIAATAG